MSIELARALIATLPDGVDGLFNPWRDNCPLDDVRNPEAGPEGRLKRLAAHLDRSARFILVGEAPGYQGCRYSGVAFTSERQLLDGAIPGIERLSGRLTVRDASFTEPSATIVWRALYKLGIAEHVVNWNALQMHPHVPGKPMTNRTPTTAELALGQPALALLREHFSATGFIAVGRNAAKLLTGAGIQVVGTVRHPANGGANEFNSGLSSLI